MDTHYDYDTVTGSYNKYGPSRNNGDDYFGLGYDDVNKKVIAVGETRYTVMYNSEFADNGFTPEWSYTGTSLWRRQVELYDIDNDGETELINIADLGWSSPRWQI